MSTGSSKKLGIKSPVNFPKGFSIFEITTKQHPRTHKVNNNSICKPSVENRLLIVYYVWEKVRTMKIRTSKFKKNIEKSSKDQNIESVYLVHHYYDIRTSKSVFLVHHNIEID
jgi:hypothetical protein